MLGSPAGPGGPSQRGLWPLAPAPAPTATTFSTDGLGKYGVYSLFPGGPTFGSALYSHASTIGRFASGQFQQSSGNTFHTAHKGAPSGISTENTLKRKKEDFDGPDEKKSRIPTQNYTFSDSLFSASGYTFGAPTPPPGSPYSPIPVAQLELLAKGFNSNIIIQQPPPTDYPQSPKKIQEKQHCEEKCCNLRPQKTCNCQVPSPIKGSKYADSLLGCSRTNPIEWTGVNVKKEPGACQVAEITTSASPIIKLEVTSPTQKNGDGLLGSSIITSNGNNIPVGIAIARQRVQHELIASPTLPPTGLLTTVNAGGQIKELARISEIDPAGVSGSMAASSTMGGQAGGALTLCSDDRSAGLAAWHMGGAHNQALATPTLWQYPAPLPVEPMVPLPVPMPPVGFQLVRDPTTGGLLLLPTTTGLESLQQAVVWPSYQQPSSVLLPSLSQIPPPPLQLLSSASSDYLSSSTTLHQHTQTHSTRLVAVTTDTKRKMPMPLPATTLIKIETDATLDQTKTMQAVSTIANNTGTVFTDQNMTPLVIYQHPPNLILSQTPTGEVTSCRSQATSPVTCLTPPPEAHIQEEEQSTVQDASNQTDTPLCSEDDNTTHTIADVVEESKVKSDEILVDKLQIENVGEYCDTTEMLPDVIEELPRTSENEEFVEEKVPDEVVPEEVVEEVQQENASVEKEEVSPPEPDLSGLELLSNSIVEFESCRSSIEETEEIPVVKEDAVESEQSTVENNVPVPKPPADDSLGGLDLLCALAEQRIMEECEKPKTDKERSKDRKREKRKSKKHSSDEPRRKKMKSDKHRSEDKEHRKRKDRHSSDSDKEKRVCSCQTENYRTYKTPESEEEVKKFIASKTQRICCKGDWPCMNAMELDMRMKLAELQRQYREKQKELSKLKPKRHSSDCSKKRSRKKSTHSTHSDRSSTPPPLLDKMDVPVKPNKDTVELLKPPTLCAMPKIEEIYKTNHSDSDLSPEKHSSSKKRKVGRPKKLLASSGEHVATETIVAKKPKSSFVGYLLAAKEKLKLQNKTYPDATPPRYVEETIRIKHKKNKNNNHIIASEMKSSKMRPKLKAEATVKSYADDEHIEWETITEEEDEEEQNHEELMEEIIEEEAKTTEYVVDSNENETISEVHTEVPIVDEVAEEVKPEDTRCTLTAELLEVDKLRVLTAMGGLFYAGQLNALEPPDVYSITLDGERGNRPHIMSREEILRDAIVEVAPKSTDDLPFGTRLCAYWSQQYRCLYPGSVAEPGTPDPQLDGKFVSVEFDDGDSGRIALEDIRYLPSDYPIIEYDPNPLLSLCKRRRRTSTSVSTEEKIITKPHQNITLSLPQPEPVISQKDAEADSQTEISTTDRYKEKKRLKKKKREKLRQKLMHQDKKKKKKHKCNDEMCKHRKHHKKHRKHKKHHEKMRIPETETNVIEEKVESLVDPEEDAEEEIEEMVTEISSEVNEMENIEEYADDIANPDDEVTMDDIIEATNSQKSKKIRDRQESCESRSKMSAFLPARQLWGWSGKGYKRQRAKGRSKKSFYKSIQRGKEIITVGDSAVFLSTGRPDRPYIGRIEAMWELCGTMVVKVKWFYHPEETIGCPQNLEYPGALFESPHVDENDVQTIAHKCEVLPLKEYTERLGDDPQRYATIYDNNDIYYLAGYYDPTSHAIKIEPGIPFTRTN